jgi:hypothetical protein
MRIEVSRTRQLSSQFDGVIEVIVPLDLLVGFYIGKLFGAEIGEFGEVKLADSWWLVLGLE